MTTAEDLDLTHDGARRTGSGFLTARLEAVRSDARLAYVPMILATALSFALNAWHLGSAGLGNTYYAAAVRSMTLSWSNFFFGAFDPGGMITVDKPPVFLWVGAISARIFGYSSWSILLPSAIAGAATVALLWFIARRRFGVFAATVAAFALALTPITVAVDRLNLPEPFFILALVGAAGAVLRAVEEPRGFRWVALAGVLVGIAFNTKMLAGWIPGPAFALALIVATPWPWRPVWRAMLGRLVVLAVVTLVASASWGAIADLTPASSRPYIGGSTDNSVFDLAFGYNGFGRVEGQGIGGRGPARPVAPATPTNRGGGAPNAAPANPGALGGFFGGGAGAPGGMNGPGGIIAGQPGALRMIDAANGGQIGWLLSFGLVGGALALWAARADPKRRGMVVLFLGWVVLYASVFSYARGIYHSYYTAALAPGIAALAGIGAVTAVDLVRRDRRWLVAPLVLVVVGVALQLHLQGRVPVFYGWMRPWLIGGAVLGVGLMALATLRRFAPRISPHLGMAVVVGALLLIPAGWSISEAANPSLNTTLPQAGPRGGAAARTFGSQAFDAGTTQLAAWLREHSDPGATWDLAVTSAQNASTMIAYQSVSVMAMGGFSGNDPAMTTGRFADLVGDGEVRYVLVGGGRGGPGGGFGGMGGANVPGTRTPGGSGAAPAPAPGRGFAGTNGQLAPRITPGTGQGVALRTAPGGGTAVTPGNPPAPLVAPATRGFTNGSAAVMSAVQQACTRVTDASLPAQYRDSLYDCSGRSAALAALAPR